MGSIHHANAKTTARVRAEIQVSTETIAALSKRFSLNPKTVRYWKHAGRVTDKKSGPARPRSTVLTPAGEQVICEFRRQTKFSLDDVFISLKAQIPALTRSNLHRCLRRHGLNRLPVEGAGVVKKAPNKFREYEIGYAHIDITEIRILKEKLYLFVGIDGVCKYVYVELHQRMTQEVARGFLENFIADCPFKIHTTLTDNGAQFTYALLAEHLRPKDKIHMFDQACARHGIKHKLTRFRHPWTNGQVEIMNKKIKAHTTAKYHYESTESLKKHLMAYLLAYNFQRPLKALKYMSPYDKMIAIYEEKAKLFRLDPTQKIMGLNT